MELGRDTLGRSLAHQPALDGMRALAIAMVLCFHAGFGWMQGGYFGVSMFFTLSGFLITMLLLTEFRSTGTVSLRRFYSRRLRRLLPASTACLLAVLAARALGEFAMVPGFPGEMRGAVAQVYNWVQLAGSSSYSALFTQSATLVSPVAHYWSLAIEEQFYLLWPMAALALARRAKRQGQPVLRPMALLTVLCALAAPAIGVFAGPEAAYWATPARLGELLVGATAAAWLVNGGRVPAGVRFLAPAALVAVVVLAVVLPVGSGPAYTGWMTPLALISVTLVLSLQVPGAVRNALSLSPVVWLGTISYGVYLYHWPVFLLLRQRGWQLAAPGGFAVATSITLAVSVASFYALEQPIRRCDWAPRPTYLAAAAAVSVALLAIAAMPTTRGFLEPDRAVLAAATIDVDSPPIPLRPSATAVDVEAPVAIDGSVIVEDSVAVQGSVAVAPPVVALSGSELPPAPNRPIRIMVVGDSTAFYMGQGLAAWAGDHPQYAQVDVLYCQGCGFILDGTITSFEAASFVAQSRVVVRQEMLEHIADVQPDVVVLMSTVNDIANRKWDEAEGVLTPADPRYRARMVAAYRAVTDSVLAAGVPHVVWVNPPIPVGVWDPPEMGEDPRNWVQHEVIRGVAAEQGPAVRVNELDAWFSLTGHAVDRTWRPDGTHLTEASAKSLASEFLGAWLVQTALRLPTG